MASLGVPGNNLLLALPEGQFGHRAAIRGIVNEGRGGINGADSQVSAVGRKGQRICRRTQTPAMDFLACSKVKTQKRILVNHSQLPSKRTECRTPGLDALGRKKRMAIGATPDVKVEYAIAKGQKGAIRAQK